MAHILPIPLANYPTGQQTFGPVDIPDGLRTVGIQLSRSTTATPTIWPLALTTLAVLLERSSDGGVTWLPSGSYTDAGGIATGKGGGEAPLSSAQFDIGAGVGRLLQAKVDIANGPLRTQGSLLAG